MQSSLFLIRIDAECHIIIPNDQIYVYDLSVDKGEESDLRSLALCRYWADIDTQLRRSAYEKKVRVRLLISCWQHSPPVMLPFLKSLASVHDSKNKLDIQVVSGSPSFIFSVMYPLSHKVSTSCLFHQRLFVVPADPRQKKIPFARVNHNKYMVTDKVAYIGKGYWFLRSMCEMLHFSVR